MELEPSIVQPRPLKEAKGWDSVRADGVETPDGRDVVRVRVDEGALSVDVQLGVFALLEVFEDGVEEVHAVPGQDADAVDHGGDEAGGVGTAGEADLGKKKRNVRKVGALKEYCMHMARIGGGIWGRLIQGNARSSR